MGLANKALHETVSNPRKSWRRRTCLDLAARRFGFSPPGPEASRSPTQLRALLAAFMRAGVAIATRKTACAHTEPMQLLSVPCMWLLKRVRRYSHIVCDICDGTVVRAGDKLDTGVVTGIVPPLLPLLLEACGPTTELTVSIQPAQGKQVVPKRKLCLPITEQRPCDNFVMLLTYLVYVMRQMGPLRSAKVLSFQSSTNPHKNVVPIPL